MAQKIDHAGLVTKIQQHLNYSLRDRVSEFYIVRPT